MIAVIAQIIEHSGASTAATAILSLFFPSMNYMFVIGYLGRYQEQSLLTNILYAALATSNQSSPSRLSRLVLFVFLIVQIITYPVLAIFVERWLHGTNSKERTIGGGPDAQVSSRPLRLLASPTSILEHFGKSCLLV